MYIVHCLKACRLHSLRDTDSDKLRCVFAPFVMEQPADTYYAGK